MNRYMKTYKFIHVYKPLEGTSGKKADQGQGPRICSILS